MSDSLIYAIVVGVIIFAVILYLDWHHTREDKQFLKYVRVTFPNAEFVEAISVSTSDKQAMDNIERRLRDASRHL
jgi:hypothetical protein